MEMYRDQFEEFESGQWGLKGQRFTAITIAKDQDSQTLERVFTKKTDIRRRTNKMLFYLKIALWLMNTTIESVENRNRNTEADIMNSPTIYRK